MSKQRKQTFCSPVRLWQKEQLPLNKDAFFYPNYGLRETKNIDLLPEIQTKKINLTSGNFHSEEVFIRAIDYYFSNPVVRASKTMSDCRLEKNRNTESRKTG